MSLRRLRLKCDGTRAETRFRLSAKRWSPFKSAGGASVQSTTGSRGVRISGSNAGYTVFRGSVKGTGYPLHSPVSLSISLLCVTVCHHISTGLYTRLCFGDSWFVGATGERYPNIGGGWLNAKRVESVLRLCVCMCVSVQSEIDNDASSFSYV